MNEQRTTKQQWLSGISNMLQFILGFLIGVILIATTAAGAAFYYFKKVSSTTPDKPVYVEETTPKNEEIAKPTPTETAQVASNGTETEAVLTSETVEPEVVAKVETKPELPEGAYYATVTWPQGLSLRADPNLNAARIGGISYDAKIIILEESGDKRWQRVRIPWNQQEGWVKNGNTKRTSY